MQASEDSSFTNALTSSGVGGSPIRSKVTRRSQVRFAAGGEGVRPAASSRARMKASMGEEHQESRLTGGGLTDRTGWYDQCRRRSARTKVCVNDGDASGASGGVGAP